MYKQILGLHDSRISDVGHLKMVKQLYRTKGAKNPEFIFEHCWLFVKDYPKWVDGWDIRKVTPSKRNAREFDQVSYKDTSKFSSTVEDVGNVDSNKALRDHPSKMNAAKKVQKLAKACEEALYTQEAATKMMAVATINKVALLIDNTRCSS